MLKVYRLLVNFKDLTCRYPVDKELQVSVLPPAVGPGSRASNEGIKLVAGEVIGPWRDSRPCEMCIEGKTRGYCTRMYFHGVLWLENTNPPRTKKPRGSPLSIGDTILTTEWAWWLLLAWRLFAPGYMYEHQISKSANKVCVHTQRTHNAIITSLWRQRDVATSFWRHTDDIIASYVRWAESNWHPVNINVS